MQVTIFHNPRCSKSRETLALIQASGVQPNIVEYLKTPLSVQALKELLQLLGCNAMDIIRTNETIYKELGLGGQATEEALIEAMARHPILMNRPIVCTNKAAKLCRPPELVKELLDQH